MRLLGKRRSTEIFRTARKGEVPPRHRRPPPSRVETQTRPPSAMTSANQNPPLPRGTGYGLWNYPNSVKGRLRKTALRKTKLYGEKCILLAIQSAHFFFWRKVALGKSRLRNGDVDMALRLLVVRPPFASRFIATVQSTKMILQTFWLHQDTLPGLLPTL